MIPTVVKRKGRKEKFDERKVYASVYSVCMSKYMNALKCENLANKITKIVSRWLKNKQEISSTEIRKKIRLELRKQGRDLVYHYDKNIPDLSRL